MKKLTKPLKGILFSIGRFTLSANFATTLIWADEGYSEVVGFKRDYHLLEVKYSRTQYGVAMTFYILPLSFSFGWSL